MRHTFKNVYFLCPHIDRSGSHTFWSVPLFVCKNFYSGHIFQLVRDRAFIFHMSIPCDKIFLFVPRSRSNIKVTIFKNGCCGGIGVSQTHLVCLVYTSQSRVLTVYYMAKFQTYPN